MMTKRNEKKIIFVIHPTIYNDYDILAIGHLPYLKKLYHKTKASWSHLIKESRSLDIPVLILDTCDTLRDAKSCIKYYKKLYVEEIL